MKTFHQFMEQISPQQASINAAEIKAKSLETRQHNRLADKQRLHVTTHFAQKAAQETKNMVG